MENCSLYIHIPFCKSKCHYCDFVSFKCNNETMKKYINNLIKELSLYKNKLNTYSIKTIFIGGGTPSSIDPIYIEKILQYVYSNFNVENLEEVSMEANPGTLDEYKVKKYKENGINRVSLGVQSLNDDILKSIGRIHNSKDFYNSLNLLRSAGFKNINADLMFSLPGQTVEDMEATLSEIINLKLEHISLYSLIIEDNTILGKKYSEGLIEPIDEVIDRKIYSKSVEMLKNESYNHYEISNFAKDNKKSLHNLAYWKIQPYLGVGLSSHSNIFSKRFFNHSDMTTYNSSLNEGVLPIEGEEIIHKSTQISEYMIMGLRLIEGIDIKEYQERFSEDIYSRYGDAIEKHKNNGLIKVKGSHIALTNRGLDLANLVELDFYN